MTGAAGTVLHPILELRLGAGALSPVVLILAPGVLFSQFARATREDDEAQDAVVGLVGQGQEARVVHVGMGCVDGIQVPRAEDFLLCTRHLRKRRRQLFGIGAATSPVYLFLPP